MQFSAAGQQSAGDVVRTLLMNMLRCVLFNGSAHHIRLSVSAYLSCPGLAIGQQVQSIAMSTVHTPAEYIGEAGYKRYFQRPSAHIFRPICFCDEASEKVGMPTAEQLLVDRQDIILLRNMDSFVETTCSQLHVDSEQAMRSVRKSNPRTFDHDSATYVLARIM